MSSKDYVPILKTLKDINQEVIDKINHERSGKQLGLKCRFPRLNIAVGKYFRFGQVYSINGLSGHGKSAMLNILLQDFKNEYINKEFHLPLVVCHNSFEMLPVDEVIRSVSGKLDMSHSYLLSSEIKDDAKYNTISDQEVAMIREALSQEEDLDHYYFEEPTTTIGILKNVKKSIEFFQEKYNTTAVPAVVVAIDHTLLVEPLEKKDSVLDTMTRLAKLAIFLKKRGYMVFFIGQLNNEIERPERIKNPDLHYPMKSDIYAQAQLFNACDVVATIHQPELLGIQYYGKNKYLTHLLVHFQLIKNRFGKVGSIWLQNRFNEGKLIDIVPTKKDE